MQTQPDRSERPGTFYVPHVNKVYVTDGAHDQYADEQLVNLQKRICLIEFLRLGLIIGCQGAMLGLPKIQTDHTGRFFLCFPILSAVRKFGIKTATVSHIHELLKKKRLEI